MKIKRYILPSMLACCLCLLVSCFYFGTHLLLHMTDRVGGSWDSGIYVWSIAWWKYALSHHLNPFITNYIWYPTGFNAARATTVPGLFLLTLPIQLLWGVEAAFNTIYMLAPGLAATTMFLLCYYLVRQFWPSLLSGMLFGFSAYMVAQTTNHLNLTAGVFLIPLMVLLTVWLIEQRVAKVWFVAGCGFCLILLFLISTEIFLTFTVASCIAGILALWIFKSYRYKILQAIPAVVLVYCVTILIVSPYLYYFFTDTLSDAYGNVRNSNDILSFLIPTKLYWLKSSSTIQLSSHWVDSPWTGSVSEENAYLGVPILLVLLLFLKQHWSTCYAKYLFILFLIFSMISLGVVARIAGTDVLTLWPVKLLLSVPPMKWALPSRFALYVSMVVSLMVVYWLVQVRIRWAAFLLVVLALIFLMPTRNLKDYPRYVQFDAVNYPLFFSKGMYQHWLTAGEPVMILPFSSPGLSFPVAAYYQAKTGFYFKMVNSMSGNPTPLAFSGNSLVKNLISNGVKGASPEAMLRFLQQYHVTYLIVLDREYSHPRWRMVLSKIKVAPVHIGGVRLYDLKSLHPSAKSG